MNVVVSTSQKRETKETSAKVARKNWILRAYDRRGSSRDQELAFCS